MEVAQLRSLRVHLRREVVVLGPQHEISASDNDDHLVLAFYRSLSIAQRVVFAQHPESYARLDHQELQQLLPTIKIVKVAGDVGALQLLLRVQTTEFTQRQSVGCYLDKPSQQLFVVSSSADATTTTQQLFDALVEVCRQCFGAKIATSVANVLYLATMQPTRESLDHWLVDTQRVAPLDARAGKTLWIAESYDANDELRPRATIQKRPRDEAATGAEKTTEDLEDGELEDEQDAKRAKPHHAWETPTGGGGWAGGVAAHSFSGDHHAAPPSGYFQSAYSTASSHHATRSAYGASSASTAAGSAPPNSYNARSSPVVGVCRWLWHQHQHFVG